MLGGTPGEVNPNSAWLNSRGMWLSYSAGVLILHFALLSIPFLSVAWAWTLTNVVHNAVSISYIAAISYQASAAGLKNDEIATRYNFLDF